MLEFLGSVKLPLLVFIGGGIGSVARWGLGRWALHYPVLTAFPWPTFIINVLGSLMIGLFAVAFKDRASWLALLSVGVCGGFTTFSTFSLETMRLLEEDRPSAAMVYAGGSIIAGLFAVWLGTRLFR